MISLVLTEYENISLYRIGSMSLEGQSLFHSELSDIDILAIAKANSLDGFTANIGNVIRVTAELSAREKGGVEVFSMSPQTVTLYHACLSVIAGSTCFHKDDHISGPGYIPDSKISVSLTTRHRLYEAKSREFRLQSIWQLPMADTERIRKIAKKLLRGLKTLVCAKASICELNLIESRLLKISSFKELSPLLGEVLGLDVDEECLDGALAGVVDDWPAWMIAQDGLTKELMRLPCANVTSADIVSGSVCTILQDLLVLRVKDIINEKKATVRLGYIADFAADAAGVIVKLALNGVDELADFQTKGTPRLVWQSYGIVVDSLKGGPSSVYLLSASIILLEYALEKAIIHMNNERV